LALIACGRFQRTCIGTLIIFLRISSLQATTKNEFVRKFITRAWPIVEYENIVRQSISKSHFLCDKNLYLAASKFSVASFTRYSGTLLFSSLWWNLIYLSYLYMFLYLFCWRDFMWNQISGSIPKEIGNIKSLVLL
jgi:hypothetical protein